jgi:hypothetical protein
MSELKTTKSAVLGVAMANSKPGDKKHEAYKDDLNQQLGDDGPIIKSIPFYNTRSDSEPVGYVIETNSKLMICFRGTKFKNISEVKSDLNSFKSQMDFGDTKLEVHAGFKNEYESLKTSLDAALQESDTTKEVEISGHSLGGALANLAALDFQTRPNEKKLNISAVTTFGAPRVFSNKAAQKYNQVGLSNKTTRIKHGGDPVPGIFSRVFFSHVGKKVTLDSTKLISSPLDHTGGSYRKAVKNMSQEDLAKAIDPQTITDSLMRYVNMVINITARTWSYITQSQKPIISSVNNLNNISIDTTTATKSRTPGYNR